MGDEESSLVAETVALSLLEIGAVKVTPETPYTWASGWKSPIYCDNRLALSYPTIRTSIKKMLAEAVSANFPEAEGVAGVATAGIPQGMLVADALNLSFVYVRPKPKEHGMSNLIEGKIQKGQKIVVIEDLISTGGSSLKAVEALRDAGFAVLGMVAIFSYGFAVAQDNFDKHQVKLITLSNYDQLIAAGIKSGRIQSDHQQTLQQWRINPSEWLK